MLAWCCLLPVQAQQLAFGVLLTGAEAQVEPALELLNMEVDGTKVDLRFAGGVDGPAEFGLEMRATTSFGPVGNIIVTVSNELSTARLFDFSLEGRGVFGPVAAELELMLFNSNPGMFRLEDGFGAGRAHFDADTLATGLALDLSASYRFTRSTQLKLEPSLYYLHGSGIGLRLLGDLGLANFIAEDDASILLQAYGAPGLAQGHAALGLGYKLERGALPPLRALLWLGAGSRGIWPGAGLGLQRNLRRQEIAYGFMLEAQPFRLDAPPYRLNAYYNRPLGPGYIDLGVFGAPFGRSSSLPAFGFSSGYRIPL